MTKEKQIEEHCSLVDIIGDAMHDWDDYLDECYENGVSPVEDIEDFIADGVIHAGYRKQSKNVIELSCNVGDNVYENYHGHIFEYVITSIEISSPYDIVYKVRSTESWNRFVRFIGFDKYDIGKSVFLTREEAKKGR